MKNTKEVRELLDSLERSAKQQIISVQKVRELLDNCEDDGEERTRPTQGPGTPPQTPPGGNN